MFQKKKVFLNLFKLLKEVQYNKTVPKWFCGGDHERQYFRVSSSSGQHKNKDSS